MNLPPILKDRRAQIGLGVAAVAGAYALSKHRGTSGSTGGGSALDGATGGGGVGGYNSTATDLAQQLSDYKAGQQQILDQFQQGLNTTLDGLRLPSTPTPDGAGLAATSPVVVTSPVTALPTRAPTVVATPAATQTGTTAGVATGSINRTTIGQQVAKYLPVVAGLNWTKVEKQTGKTAEQLRALNGGTLSALKAGPDQRVRIG